MSDNQIQFTDAEGAVWRPVPTTPVIMQTCRLCGLSIAKVTSLDINIADALELLWLMCQSQAVNCTRDQFFERLTPAILPAAVAALWTAVGEAFPQVKGVAPGAGPEIMNPLSTFFAAAPSTAAPATPAP